MPTYLNLSRDDLMKEIADFLGWGMAVPTDATKLARATSDVASGLRQVYFCGQPWSFLQPVCELVVAASIDGTISGTPSYSATTGLTTLDATDGIFLDSQVGAYLIPSSGTMYPIVSRTDANTAVVRGDASGESGSFTISFADVEMPADFGGTIGDITFSDRNTLKVQKVGEGRIRELRQAGSQVLGRPQYFAIVPQQIGTAAQQRFDARFWPAPDTGYTLYYQKQILPAALESADYPYGGPELTELVLESCLAIAEQRTEDTLGLHTQKFQALLAAAIAADGEKTMPDFFERGRVGDETARRGSRITYNGIRPEDY